MKRAWDPALLTVLHWHGEDPEVGDVLETTTGRRYMITRFRLTKPVNGKTKIKAFETIVLPKDEPLEPGQRVHQWRWGKRDPSTRVHLRRGILGRRVLRKY